MVVQTGTDFVYTPGDVEYKRTALTMNNYYINRRTPLLFMAGKGKTQIVGDLNKASQKIEIMSQVVENAEFDWFEHNPEFTRATTFATAGGGATLAAGTRGTAKAYPVTDASIFFANQVVLNTATNEQFLVVSTDTTTTPHEVTLQPAFFQTENTTDTVFPGALTDGTSSANTAGDVLMIIGNSQPEGGTATDIYNTNPTRRLQYTQIFRKSIGETGTNAASKNYGKVAFKDRMEQNLGSLFEDVEDQLLFGKLNKSTLSNKPHRTFLGIREFIQTNVKAASALVGSGNDLSTARLDEIGELAYDRPSNKNKIALCGGEIMRKVNALARGDNDINVKPGDEDLGLRTRNVITPFGDLVFVFHPRMNNDGLKDEIIIVDRDNLKMGNLRNRELRFRDNEQANDADERKGSWLAEWTFLPMHEATHARITGIVPTF